jgi:DNA primase
MKGKITPELLQKIKEAVNLREVVGEHVVLRKAGASFSGLCPFHQERSPSFNVNEQKQFYYCYGCQKGGDVVSFVMEIHGMSFPEAIEELAERGRVALPKDIAKDLGGGSPEEEARRAAAREKLNLSFKLNRFVAAFYHSSLAQNQQARAYLSKRGVSEDMIRQFYIGSSSSSWDALTQHFIAKNAPLPIAQELGLIRPSPKTAPGGSGFFDLFRNRVMFPILDLRGKVVGFGGRSLPAASEGGDSDGPKYMNSVESPIFHKGKIAYGLYQAQKHVREKDEVILVEGYFDVIALHAAGFQNVVATCGTALTPDHLQVFKRFASKVTVLFDGDKAGITATERAMELGLSHGAILYGAVIPKGLDPDEILFDQETGAPTADGKAQMTAILSAAQPLLDSRIQEASVQASQGPEARTQALKQIGQWLAMYSDPVGREVRIQDVETKFGVSRALVLQTMGQVGAQNRGAAPQQNRPMGNPTQAYPTQGGLPRPRAITIPKPGSAPKKASNEAREPSSGDRVLLAALAMGGKYLESFRELAGNLPRGFPAGPDSPSSKMTISDLFDYVPARVFMTQILKEGEVPADFALNPGTLAEMDLDPQVRSILMEGSVSGTEISADDLKGAIHRGVRRLWARFSQQIKQAMQDAEAKKDAGLHEQLSKEYLDVERKMKEFISFYDEA